MSHGAQSPFVAATSPAVSLSIALSALNWSAGHTLLMTAPTRGSSVMSLKSFDINLLWPDSSPETNPLMPSDSLEFVPLAFATQKPTKKTNFAFAAKDLGCAQVRTIHTISSSTNSTNSTTRTLWLS